MSPDLVFASSVPSALERDELPPPRYALRVRWREGAAVGDVEWAVRSVVLEERLHAPYVLTVEAIADAPDLDPESLLGARVELELARGSTIRLVHGVVLEHELGGERGDGTWIRFHVGPALALLGLYRRCRVFQGVSVPKIVTEVVGRFLVEQGSELCVDRLVATYEPRDYCVQYRETDLDFVLRILAEAGITLMFDHGEDAETVVLVDASQALPPAGREPLEVTGGAPPVLPFVPERADELPVESIRTLRQRTRLHPRYWSATAWDWKSRPPTRLRCESDRGRPGGGAWEADEERPDEGEDSDGAVDDPTLRRVHLEQRRGLLRGAELQATSNATSLRAGSVFELEGAPCDGAGQAWVVTRITHRGDAPHAAVGGSGVDAKAEYGNELECQPLRLGLVPPRPPRPRVAGVHTAVVTGPPGEPIHTDRFGRVRVRMLWDDAAHDGEHASCWLRVVLPWAGDQLGMVFIPRVGTEVVVSFVDGDPDRPLCSGCVFNGGAMPPYDLPGGETRTVLRTMSLDGEGYNELSFQDAAGVEEVFLHAGRDLREYVGAEHSTYVAGNRRSVVGASRSTAIAKDEHLTVTGDHHHTVSGDVTEHYRGAYRLQVSEAPKTPKGDEGMAITVTRGTFEVEAADAIVLRCGESRIELQRGQIVLTSPQIVERCSTAAGPYPTSVTLAAGGIELAANELRHRVVEARVEADRRVSLGVGPEAAKASLCLMDDAATLRAQSRVEVEAVTVGVLGREAMNLDAESVGVHGKQVAVNAETRIDIATPGQVIVRGNEKISLN